MLPSTVQVMKEGCVCCCGWWAATAESQCDGGGKQVCASPLLGGIERAGECRQVWFEGGTVHCAAKSGTVFATSPFIIRMSSRLKQRIWSSVWSGCSNEVHSDGRERGTHGGCKGG